MLSSKPPLAGALLLALSVVACGNEVIVLLGEEPDRPVRVCGNGVVENGEACDDGNAVAGDGCSSRCQNEATPPACGNGVIDDGEECDDGNADNGDACVGDCRVAFCGDGFVQAGDEACDDGNSVDDDSCSNACTFNIECGNGVVDPGEQCDDGNGSNTDACPDGPGGTCQPAFCGDGFVRAGVETCDVGGTCGIDGWTVDLGMPPAQTSWGVYAGAPPSFENPGVPFPGPVFGTDGNQTPPYPATESENSSVESPLTLIPSSLTFESWHVDEGAVVDNKRIVIAVEGEGEVEVLDCGMQNQYPFCIGSFGPRSADAWDSIAIPVPPELVGKLGTIRIVYETLDNCCSFEQGWYLRNANFFTLCP